MNIPYNYTKTLARFVRNTRFEDLPKQVIERTKLHILDAIGITLGAFGTKHPIIKSLISLVSESGGRKESTIFGSGEKTTCLDAAMVNSIMANFLDASDGHYAGGHINDRIVPVAFAVAEREEATGRDLITATLLGYETYIRLAYTMFRKTQPASLRSPYFVVLGVISGALTAGKLLGLDEDQLAGATGLAASIQICGAQYALSGGHEKDLVPGHESRRAVISALMAQKGILGSQNILEGKRGLCHALSDEYDLDELVKNFGQSYKITECYFKPFPACRFLHTSIEASLKILHKYKINPEEIDSVVVKTNSDSAGRANYEIRSHVNAIFSHQFQVAVALREGKVDLPISWREKMQDPIIMGLIKKVRIEVDPKFEKMYQRRTAYRGTWPAKVQVKMQNGKTYTSTVVSPKGDMANPMSREDIKEKFFRLGSMALPKDRLNQIFMQVSRLEQIGDVSELTELAITTSSPNNCDKMSTKFSIDSDG
jgi:2-methylcitrate dehydratase PrpD